MAKDTSVGQFNIEASNAKVKQGMMQRQVTENLLEMSINIDDNYILDLESQESMSRHGKNLRVKFNLDGQAPHPHRNKPDENLKPILIKERLPLDRIRKVDTIPKSARQLQEYTKNAYNTQLQSNNSNNKKVTPSFSLLLDAEQSKPFSTVDNSMTISGKKRSRIVDLDKSAKIPGKSSDMINGTIPKGRNGGRLVSQRISADHIDFNFSKNGNSKSELLKNVKTLKQPCDNSAYWADVFKKACNNKK